MNSLELISTGLVYRNPKPHLRAIHAWHPSIVSMGGNELLCTFDLGQGAESLDYRTYRAASKDGGKTWTEPVPLFQDNAPRRATHTVRVRRLRDGNLVAMGARFYRDNAEEGIASRKTDGIVPMDVILLRSTDGGVTWSAPVTVKTPLVGPAFEICHTMLELSDGRWLFPTSTWKGWDGDAPNGMKAIALVSRDQGRTWPEFMDVLDAWKDGVAHWEQSLIEMQDGRLLAVGWAFDMKDSKTLPTPYAISADRKKFGARMPTGIKGQTAKILQLKDGRIFCLYRREDKPGLWANLSKIEDEKWINLAEAPVWQGLSSAGMRGGAAASEELSVLKCGFPQMAQLPDGDVFGVFWCCEDGIYNIRWARVKI